MSIVHGGVRNSDGKYTAKDMAGAAQIYNDTDEFQNGHMTGPINSTITHQVVYYKRN